MELATTFIGRRISEQLRKMTTMKDKEKLLFDVLKIFNEEQCTYLKNIYNDLNTADKKEFLAYCEHKIHFNQPSMNEHSPIFYRIMELSEKYADFLKPDKMFINKFGRVAGYKINIYIDISCILSTNYQKEKLRTIPFAITLKIIKYL